MRRQQGLNPEKALGSAREQARPHSLSRATPLARLLPPLSRRARCPGGSEKQGWRQEPEGQVSALLANV